MDGVERKRLSDGAVLWTQSAMRPGAPAAVLLHGGPGMWDYLGPAADLLDDVSTHRYDQRGCGRSTPHDDHRMARYVADLEELRRHHGHERWTVLGHSFGARLALAYAAAHPDRVAALVHCSGVGLDWPTSRSVYHRRMQERLGPVTAARLAELEHRDRTPQEEVEWRTLCWIPEFADPGDAERLARAAALTPLAINLRCHEAMKVEAAARSLADELAECAAVSAPVLAVHGSEDPRPIEAVRALVEALPAARLTVIEGAGHHPWVERPDAFAAAVREVLPR